VVEIQPETTALSINGQLNYKITVHNKGGQVAEDVVLKIQLPTGLSLVNPQPLVWELVSESLYQLAIEDLPPVTSVQNLILLVLNEEVAVGEILVTPALSVEAANEGVIFELAAGSGANVVVVQEEEGSLNPVETPTIEEPHTSVRLFLPIIAR